MSENPRKRQLENHLSMIGNKGTYEEDVDDNSVDDGLCNDNPWYVYDEDDENDDHDDCQLQRAIKEDHPIDSILELIKLFPMQAKHKNELGEYPLHTACEYSHDDVAEALLELYPEAVQHKNSSGLYPLHLAFHSDISDDMMMKLIGIFPKPIRKSSTNGSALHFVCRSYHVSETLLRKLIEINPKSIQEKDCNGFFPIYYAIRLQHSFAIIKILLNGDPLGMQRIAECESKTGTILHLACDRYNVDLVKYLMQRSDCKLNVRDSSGRTPLHVACSYLYRPMENNRNQIVDMMLNHPDVDVNAKDNLNDTPLHKALKYYGRYCCDTNAENFPYIIQKLLDHECILINEKNNHDKTPLDLINDCANILESNKNELTRFQQNELICYKKIINLLKERLAKRRWQMYCYHVKNFIDSCE